MSRTIGIDLGTTNSVVAIMQGAEALVITNEEGGRLTPSVVAYDDKGNILVGQIAKRQAIVNPENTIYSIKRLMGRKFDEVKEEAKRLSYRVVRASNGDAHVQIRDKVLSPPELSAKVLAKLKKAAEAFLGETVTDAVITVPAYFNDSQRQATKDAGRIAGLNVKRIVNEPTAAALAYGMDKKRDEKIAVFDFGGGTFDISILEVGDGVVEVKSTNGDTRLGGDDIDIRLMDYFNDEFKKSDGIDLQKDKMALQRLKEAAEKAKVELSSVTETDINLPFITADAQGPRHLQMKISRSKFEAMAGDILERTLEPVRNALKDSGMRPSDIDQIVLVGGSTRIPKIQEMVKKFFGKEPHKGVNPDEVVAVGAALQAGVLTGEVKDVLLLDVTPLSLGVETLGGVMTRLIDRNSTIPIRKSEIFSTAEEQQPTVTIAVLQGEREFARDNKLLGRFNLEGIPPAPRGVPQIEVSFDIDANGILKVSARDMATGKVQDITITASSGLDKKEVEKLVNDANAYEQEDKKRRQSVELRNQADNFIYQSEKLFQANQSQLPSDERSGYEEAIIEAKEAIKREDASAIQATQERLKGFTYRLSEMLYKRGGGTRDENERKPEEVNPDFNVSQNNRHGGKEKNDVIDAEFE